MLSSEMARYSRQMLVPEIGLEGQNILSSSKVVVVGAGGIGSTVLLYLAGSGIGTIDVVDFDVVEMSNLHRQIIHDSTREGQLKVASAVDRMNSLNPTIVCNKVCERLSASNARDLIAKCDIVVDATDNFEARYILNDACVLENKILVSGSAVGMEGQITVLCAPSGPCYRCINPRPSLAESCRSCANAGVLGPVPGLIGCLEAIEVTKLLISLKSQSSQARRLKPLIGRQLFYDASAGDFYNFSLPHRDPACEACGPEATIKTMEDSLANIERQQAACSSQQPSLELPPSANVSAASYFTDVVCNGKKHILLDVRSDVQFHISSFERYQPTSTSSSASTSTSPSTCVPLGGLPVRFDEWPEVHRAMGDMKCVLLHHVPLSKLRGGSLSTSMEARRQAELQTLETLRTRRVWVPPSEGIALGDGLQGNPSEVGDAEGDSAHTQVKMDEVDEGGAEVEKIVEQSVRPHGGGEETIAKVEAAKEDNEGPLPVFVLCRRGIDSVLATQLLLDHGMEGVYNIEGGLTAWKAAVDTSFPMY